MLNNLISRYKTKNVIYVHLMISIRQRFVLKMINNFLMRKTINLFYEKLEKKNNNILL